MNYRLFFSPTGGTARATELVCGAMKTPFAAVDLTLPAARGQQHWFAADDLVVFGLPVYGGRLPQVPGLFDGLRGENTPAVLCACYGNRHYDDMLLEWKTEMEKPRRRLLFLMFTAGCSDTDVRRRRTCRQSENLPVR